MKTIGISHWSYWCDSCSIIRRNHCFQNIRLYFVRWDSSTFNIWWLLITIRHPTLNYANVLLQWTWTDWTSYINTYDVNTSHINIITISTSQQTSTRVISCYCYPRVTSYQSLMLSLGNYTRNYQWNMMNFREVVGLGLVARVYATNRKEN